MAGPNVIHGTSGNDLLHGTAGDDTIYGLAGDDYIDPGGNGTDVLYGGTGDDTYAYYSGLDGHPITITEYANEGTDTILSYTSMFGLPVNVENLTLKGSGDFAAWGNALDNVLTGNDGANEFRGGGGDDTLIGGKGDDIYYVDGAGDKVIEAAGGGMDSVYLGAAIGASYTLAAGQEIEKLGGLGSNSYSLIGNEFDNRIVGTNGGCYLDGGAGADVMRGGTGNDVYVVDNPGDVVDEHWGGNDTLLARTSYTLQDEIGIEIIRAFDTASTSSITLTGNNLANAIYGNAGDDILMGAGGNDTLVGNGGFDRLYGGTGDDIFVVTTGDDVIEGANGGTDHVLTEQDFALTTGQEIEWLQAQHPDSTTGLTLIGNEFGNHIVGDAGDDILAGKEGDDTLAGLGGVDLLKGGTGADRFVFRDGDTGATAATADTIADFSPAQGDRIDLSQIDANTAVAGNQAFTFHASGDDHVAGALWLTQSGNDTFVNMDTDGDGHADYLIHLADLKAASVVAADFVL